jgi:hypothetical protein
MNIEEVWKLSLHSTEPHASTGFLNRSPYAKVRYLDETQ